MLPVLVLKPTDEVSRRPRVLQRLVVNYLSEISLTVRITQLDNLRTPGILQGQYSRQWRTLSAPNKSGVSRISMPGLGVIVAAAVVAWQDMVQWWAQSIHFAFQQWARVNMSR